MTTLSIEPGLIPISPETGSAPFTKRLLRRTGSIYTAIVLLGALPWILDWSGSWKAFGAGLVFPGAGFVASLSWVSLAVIPVLVLTAVAGVAWFGSGMVVAIPTVWIGSAVVAAFTADDPHSSGFLATVAIVAAAGVVARLVLTRQASAQKVRRNERNDGLVEAVVRVREVRDRTQQAIASSAPELDSDQAAALRYAIDLAHQANDDWTGFDRIDIFQPSALRYQINQLGWALAVAQSAYAPSFHGYLSSGQRALIERYLQPEVLGYWKYERLWGHLRYNADPVGRDNIMLTGYYGINLALYAGNTGDLRYHQDGALPFQVSKRRTYVHDAGDVRDSLLENYARYHDGLCLYPCEPNWSYSACNFRGAATLAAYDRFEGTTSWPDLSAHFVTKLQEEFMTPDGGVVALRSTLTGLPVPFPTPDSVLPKELSPTMPELAQRYWALVRDEQLEQRDGRWVAHLPGTNVDFGNYTKSDMFALGGIYGSAREMGDFEVADSILATIEEIEPKAEGSALWFPGRSTLFNATLVMDRLLRPTGWHDALNVPTAPEVLTGPVLEHAEYPDVLVLAARTDGVALAVVLTPGDAATRTTLRIGRLTPNGDYRVSTGQTVTAGADGTALVEVDVAERIELNLTPA